MEEEIKSLGEKDQLMEFLKKEYDFTRKHYFFIHKDRTKYLTAFISLLGAAGYLFVQSANAHRWAIALSITSVSGVINFLFLKWFMAHRASSLTYINKLNLIRGILFRNSGGDEETKKAILSTEGILIDNLPRSREHYFYNILALLIGANVIAALYIILVHFIRAGGFRTKYFLISLTFFLLVILGFCLDSCFICFIQRKYREQNK